MSNFCIECRFYRGCDVDGNAPVCHNFMPKGKTTLFDRITASPEVLAENLIHCIWYPTGRRWISTIIVWKEFENKSEAIAATVAKLKEVEK